MVVANTDAVDRIESYQGVIYGTATGGRHMVLATAWVRRKREQVIFPSVSMYWSRRVGDNPSNMEWQHIERYLAAESQGSDPVFSYSFHQ